VETELDEIVTAKWEQGWLRLNVTRAFKKWINHPTENFGLAISTKNAATGTVHDCNIMKLSKNLAQYWENNIFWKVPSQFALT